MASSSSSSQSEKSRIPPVFVFPSLIEFFEDDPTTHKRVLTIYNPYDYEVAFKVLCNSPNKYAVVEPEGKISRNKCADIVVRHVAVSPQSVNQTDKFRIQMYEEGDAEHPISRKEVLATLHPGVPNHSSESHSLPHRAGQLPHEHHLHSEHAGIVAASGVGGGQYYTTLNGERPHQQPNIVACLAAVVCIASLFLPTEGDPSSNREDSSLFRNYPWLCLSVNQKLVFAYVLGLVTMAILRTN